MNRLATESSLYLRQHAQNPVDWYAWGPDALVKAKREQKPIFLSVGYSACHWCHVMEHESFEDADIAEALRRHSEPAAVEGELTEGLLRVAPQLLRRAFDSRHGGFGTAPKFPHAIDLRLLLRSWHRFGDDDALAMVRKTLDGMARGGIYDHLGGGFHRYSVDERWLVPHFEKMLYDNALLS